MWCYRNILHSTKYSFLFQPLDLGMFRINKLLEINIKGGHASNLKSICTQHKKKSANQQRDQSQKERRDEMPTEFEPNNDTLWWFWKAAEREKKPSSISKATSWLTYQWVWSDWRICQSEREWVTLFSCWTWRIMRVDWGLLAAG